MTWFDNTLEVSALEERRSTRENWDEERQNEKDAGKELRTHENESKCWRKKHTHKTRETPCPCLQNITD